MSMIKSYFRANLIGWNELEGPSQMLQTVSVISILQLKNVMV